MLTLMAFNEMFSVSQTCLPGSDLWVFQRLRTRGTPSPLPGPKARLRRGTFEKRMDCAMHRKWNGSALKMQALHAFLLEPSMATKKLPVSTPPWQQAFKGLLPPRVLDSKL